MARTWNRLQDEYDKFNTIGGVTATNITEPALAQIVDDYSTADTIYVCEAKVGSLSSSPVWRIKKIVSTQGAVTTWADGNADFDNIADNRTSLTYS